MDFLTSHPAYHAGHGSALKFWCSEGVDLKRVLAARTAAPRKREFQKLYQED